MSGGSYDYICYKIQDFSESIDHQDKIPRRAAFAELMKGHLVASEFSNRGGREE